MKIGHSTTYSASFFFSPPKDANRTGPGQSTEDAQAGRLRNMEEGLQRLRSMPGGMASSRQDVLNKVGWLRQQLDALKAMLLHASPQQAKALAQELRSIAGQLASIAKGLGGSGQAVPSAAAAVDAPAGEQVPVERAAAAEPASSSGTDEPGGGRSGDLVGSSDESGRESRGENASPQGMDDALLRGVLADARKLLKQAASMLKPKLAAAGKEAKDHMHAIEKSILEIDAGLQQGSASSAYSDQGNLVFDLGSLAVSGLNINLTA